MPTSPPSQSRFGRSAEARVRRHYRLRGYRVLAANAWAGGYELDLVVRRGRQLLFVEVKARRSESYGEPLEAVGPEKARRVRAAAEAWLARRPALAACEVALEVAALRGGRIERVALL